MTVTSDRADDLDDTPDDDVDPGGEPTEPTAKEPSKLVRRATDARARAEQTFERVVGQRHRLAPVDIAIRAYERDRDTGGGVLAAAVAFRLFLFMVPYVFVVFTALGLGAKVADRSPEQVARVGGISGVLGQAITSTGEISTSSQIIILITALYALLSTSRSTVKVLNAAHALVWQVPARKLKATTPLVFIAVVMGVSALTVSIGKVRAAQPTVGLGLALATIVVPAVVWWQVSRRLPHDDAPDWALLPGAALVALGAEGLHLFTIYYIAGSISGKSETYGALGAAVSVLFWAYLLGRLIVASATINATLWTRYREQAGEEAGPGAVEAGSDASGGEPVGRWQRLRTHVTEVRKLMR